MIISIHLYTKKEQHFSSKINTDYLAILLPPLVVSTIGQIHRKTAKKILENILKVFMVAIMPNSVIFSPSCF